VPNNVASNQINSVFLTKLKMDLDCSNKHFVVDHSLIWKLWASSWVYTFMAIQTLQTTTFCCYIRTSQYSLLQGIRIWEQDTLLSIFIMNSRRYSAIICNRKIEGDLCVNGPYLLLHCLCYTELYDIIVYGSLLLS